MMESQMTKMLLVLCMTAAVTVGAIGRGHKFVRCYQKLFNCSKGRVHVWHPSLSCGHQMGLC